MLSTKLHNIQYGLVEREHIDNQHSTSTRILHYRFTLYFRVHDCCVAPDTGANTIM